MTYAVEVDSAGRMTEPLWGLPTVCAYAAQVQVKTIHQWARRGHISPIARNGCYDLREILAYIDKRNFDMAFAGRRRRGETRGASDVAETLADL